MGTPPCPRPLSMPRLAFTSAGSDRHHRDCDALTERGVTIPFVHAPATARHAGRPDDLWCTLRDDDDAPLAGALVRVDRSRKLPWIRLARVEQVGRLLVAVDERLEGGTQTLAASLAAATRHLGRLIVQCYSPFATELARQELLCGRAGLRPTAPMGYTRTLRLPLCSDEAQLIRHLSSSARRNVRALEASGFVVRPLTDPALGPRLQWLLERAHERTGGVTGRVDWSAMLRAAADDPSRSVLLGVFHPHRPPDAALVGFAQGTVTESAVAYSVAGTERADDIGRTPLSYALLWALLRWAADAGHAWFDFGGVTPADEPDSPLAGISSFKRRFGGTECVMAAEWTVAPTALSGQLLRAAEGLLARR